MHRRAVGGGTRPLLQRWPRDVLQPVDQPLFHRHCPSGLAHGSGVPVLFELAHGRRDGVERLLVILSGGFALDVPAVRQAVVLQADGDSTVPTSVVFAVVDRRGTVRVPVPLPAAAVITPLPS